MNENDKLTIALREVYEAEHESFISSLDMSPHVFSGEYIKKAEKLLHRRRKSYYPFIASFGRRMITAAAAAAVIMSGSLMTVSSVRETLSEIKKDNKKAFYHVSADSEAAKYYPTEIEEEYYISEVPVDYQKTIYQKSDKKIRTVYQKSGGYYIIFYQYTKAAFNSSFFYDGEEIYTDENDQQYICYFAEKGVVAFTSFYWDNGRYIFEMSSEMDRDELYELCRSVELLEDEEQE